MALSKKEVDALIHKLRDQYRVNAAQFSEKWFSITAFEERLLHAEKSKMDMEGFILGEVANFEKIKQRYEEKKKVSELTKRVDTLIDDHYRKIEDYPQLDIHARADHEIQRFYWVLNRFITLHFSALNTVLEGFDEKDFLYRSEREITMLAKPRGKELPPRVEDHVLLLMTPGVAGIEIEKNRNRYLMDGAMALSEVIKVIERILDFRDKRLEDPVRVERIPAVSDENRKEIDTYYAGKSGYGVLIDARDFAEKAIEDFRLQNFKRK